MSLKDAHKLIRDFTELSIYFSYGNWVFNPWASWDQREYDFKKQYSYKKDGGLSGFNLWTGKSIDDTYIAPPYIPDRGLINLSGKECDPLYWLFIDVHSVEGVNEQRYNNDAEYRIFIRMSVSEAWQQLAKNLQFWYDLEEVIWNSKIKQIHIDQCWFFGKINYMYGKSWSEYKKSHINNGDGVLKIYSPVSSVDSSFPHSKNIETRTNNTKESITEKTNRQKNIAGTVFWIAFLGSYFFTSADLISSALGSLFIALGAYVLFS